MISPGMDAQQYQRSGSRNALFNFASSSPTFSSNADAILAQSLPGRLRAPAGWRSVVIQSDIPIVTDTGANLINTNISVVDNYEGHNITDTYNTSQFNQTPSPIINNQADYLDTTNTYNTSQFVNNQTDYSNTPINQSSAYQDQTDYSNTSINQSSAYQDQTVLTSEQEQNIIHRIENQQPPPLVFNKKLENNFVTYKQNISVRYLRPPTPPPPGPIIIREVRPPQPPPEPPLKIRQRPPPPGTPPPIILREKPPPIPPRTPAKVVEKLLPAPPRPPRRVIVERYGECPPKPSDVVIERWLPYKQSDRRRILIERAPAPFIPPQEPNLIVMHDSPHARVDKQFINQGVVRADPHSYLQQYGADLSTWHGSQHSHLISEATRAVPPPPGSDHHYRHDYGTSYSDDYRYGSSPYGSSSWDRSRVVSPIHRSSSYHHGYSDYDSPNHYCNQSSSRYGLETSRSYGDYPLRRESYLTYADVTPSWDHHCNSSSHNRYPSSYDRYSSSSYPPATIRVSSDNELQHVLSDLTHGHVPRSLRSY